MSPIDPAVRQAFATAARDISPLSDAALDAMASLLQVQPFERSAWLLQAGQPARWGYFVIEGLVREMYIDAAGQEHSRSFAAAGGFTGSLLDLLSGQPSVTWLQALEPTRVLAFPYAAFLTLADRHSDLGLLARRVAENLYVAKARREYEFLALSAAERFARWRQQQPGLDVRVRRRILASYLGVTPEHLSRLIRGASAAKRKV